MEPLNDVEFTAVVSAEPAKLVIVFAGSADFNTKPLLDRFLRQLHEHARMHDVRQVTADLRKAAFMDSSCMKALAWWIKTASEQPAPGYHITFVTTKTYVWQRRSLGPLTALVPEAVSIVAES